MRLASAPRADEGSPARRWWIPQAWRTWPGRTPVQHTAPTGVLRVLRGEGRNRGRCRESILIHARYRMDAPATTPPPRARHLPQQQHSQVLASGRQAKAGRQRAQAAF